MMIVRQPAALPHTGIATFCKASYVFQPEEMNAEVAILGVPSDNMASMRPGCRQAPRALRDASTRFGWLGRLQVPPDSLILETMRSSSPVFA